MTNATDQWLSIAEAASQIGITENAVRLRIRRGVLLASRDNQGRIIVRATNDERFRPSLSGQPIHDQSLPPPQAAGLDAATIPATVHLAVIEHLQVAHNEAVAALRADLKAERERHQAEITRLEQAWRAAHALTVDKFGRLLLAQRPRSLWARLFR